MSQFVLDASVVLTWCFPDENSALAEKIALMFEHGYSAFTPSFWPHEVLNALLVGEKRKRISRELVRAFLTDLAALPVAPEHSLAEAVFDRVQSLCREHGLSAYDALDSDLIQACRKAGVGLV